MAEGKHLLVVDDDNRLRSLLKKYLKSQGFRVTSANGAASARKLMKSFDFDLCVLDVMMPEEDGLSFLAGLRETTGLPVLLLTAKDLPADRIDGLRIGADDYVTKPFEPEELSLRIRSILRRTQPPKQTREPVLLSGLIFEVTRGILRRGEDVIRLTDSERQLLTILAEQRGEAVPRHILALSLIHI